MLAADGAQDPLYRVRAAEREKIPGRVSRAFRDAFPVLVPGVTLGTAAAELRPSCGPVHWIDCPQNIPERPNSDGRYSRPRVLDLCVVRFCLLLALPHPILRLSHGKALAHLQNPPIVAPLRPVSP